MESVRAILGLDFKSQVSRFEGLELPKLNELDVLQVYHLATSIHVVRFPVEKVLGGQSAVAHVPPFEAHRFANLSNHTTKVCNKINERLQSQSAFLGKKQLTYI